jgi:hypothetical protein
MCQGLKVKSKNVWDLRNLICCFYGKLNAFTKLQMKRKNPLIPYLPLLVDALGV